MSFFGAPEPPPPSHDYRTPEWLAAPENVIAGTVALDALLVRRADLAIWVGDALAYPCGVSFRVSAQWRERRGDDARPWFFGGPGGEGARFGVELADGRRAVFDPRAAIGPLHEPPAGPVLRPRSGSGGTHRITTELWLWPLPPPGPLRFVCEWAAEGVGETSAEVDATPIVEAASRAVELWPDGRPLPPTAGDVVV